MNRQSLASSPVTAKIDLAESYRQVKHLRKMVKQAASPPPVKVKITQFRINERRQHRA